LQGAWPPTTPNRRKKIESVVALGGDDVGDISDGKGGSFCIGQMPAPLKQPSANDQFPELLPALLTLVHRP
jgi:hypothetical protein